MKTQSYMFSVIKIAGLKCCPDTLIQEKRVTSKGDVHTSLYMLVLIRGGSDTCPPPSGAQLYIPFLRYFLS